MNFYILTSGIVASLATMGRFAIGAEDFLKPVMNSDIDEIPRKVMQSLFHYVSLYGADIRCIIGHCDGRKPIFENTNDVVLSYAGFALVQFIIALISSIKMGAFKLFQWVFWTLISTFSLMGVY